MALRPPGSGHRRPCSASACRPCIGPLSLPRKPWERREPVPALLAVAAGPVEGAEVEGVLAGGPGTGALDESRGVDVEERELDALAQPVKGLPHPQATQVPFELRP